MGRKRKNFRIEEAPKGEHIEFTAIAAPTLGVPLGSGKITLTEIKAVKRGGPRE